MSQGSFGKLQCLEAARIGPSSSRRDLQLTVLPVFAAQKQPKLELPSLSTLQMMAKPFVANKTLVLQTTNLGSLRGAWPSASASLRSSFASNLPVLGLFSTVSCRKISLVLKFVNTK